MNSLHEDLQAILRVSRAQKKFETKVVQKTKSITFL
jgi:hypothetical protein